jgi:hypothetical protein
VPNLESIACRLVEAKVEFVLCGGLAAFLQGSSILTTDVDVVCDMGSENISRLFGAVKDLHPYHRMTPGRIPFSLEQLTTQPFQNIYLATDWGQLDCLGNVKGIGGYGECLKLSEPIEMAGFTTMTLTLEGILIAKRAMGRPRDLQAVFELEAARERKINQH